MFSPTHTPPLESGSEDEGDSDLPDIKVGTPKKPKLETAAEPRVGLGALENPLCASSPARSSSTAATTISSPLQEKPVAISNAVRDRLFKTATFGVRAMVDGLSYLSPVKMESSSGTSESKKTANRVKKLARTLKEKTDMEKKVGVLTDLCKFLPSLVFSWRSYDLAMGSRELQKARRRNWKPRK